jgi:plasmid stability protein
LRWYRGGAAEFLLVVRDGGKVARPGQHSEGRVDGVRTAPITKIACFPYPWLFSCMKATIEFDDRLYRRLKIEAARRGRTIRDLVQEGVRAILDQPPAPAPDGDAGAGEPEWFGSLRAFARHAEGAHDLEAIRRSIAEGREPRA